MPAHSDKVIRVASANEPGIVKIVAISPTGRRRDLYSTRSDGPINAGKSPDGVLANLTVDKQVHLPVMGPWLMPGVKITVNFTLDAADGIDVSDGVFQIPIVFSDGTRKVLNATDMGITTDLPAGTLASLPIDLGAGWEVPNGVAVKLGGGPCVISIEDDTA